MAIPAGYKLMNATGFYMKDSDNSGPYALAVDGTMRLLSSVTVVPLTPTDRSTATSTTAKTLMAANATRQGYVIRNDTAINVWVNFTTTATAVAGGGNFRIAANGGQLEPQAGVVPNGAISIVAESGTPAITALEF